MSLLYRGYLLVISSAILFGCMPLGAKFTYANGLNSLSLTFYRNLLSLPIMIFLVRLRGESLKVGQKDLIKLIVLALLGGILTPILLYASYNYISSGTSTTLHFIYPAVVILAEVIFCKTHLPFKQLFSVMLCLIGVSLFYVPGADLNPLGSALAILSGITYATYIVLLSKFDIRNISGFKFSLYLSGICSLVIWLVCITTGNFSVPESRSCWVACFLFSLALSVGAVVLFRQGTLLIGSQRASILSTFEPITSILIGILWFNEPFDWRTAVASILIIIATILLSVFDAVHSRSCPSIDSSR